MIETLISQKVTFKDRYLPRIKQFLLEQKNQKEISLELGLCRETVNRKIQVWIQTDDFALWLKQAWIDKYQKVDDLEAFRALTQLLGKTLTQKIEQQVKVEHGDAITSNLQELYGPIISAECARRKQARDRTLQPDSTAKPLDSAQATSETSTVSTS